MEIIKRILFEEISYTGVLLAALLNFALGAVWYTFLFGKRWAKEVFKEKPIEEATAGSNMPLIFGISFVMGFFQALGFAFFLWSGPFSAFHGALAGLGVGVIWILTNMIKHAQFQRDSWVLVAINGGHDLLVFVVMGAFVAWWH